MRGVVVVALVTAGMVLTGVAAVPPAAQWGTTRVAQTMGTPHAAVQLVPSPEWPSPPRTG